ncbi:hypothetical protein TNCV_1737891 [Trichonephila clavipes]|nr:hypothetical protein TNCV_1737891 [Trichonephila clavipes]
MLTTRNGKLTNGYGIEMNLSQRSEPRSPSPQSQLTPCEQLKYNKAQLAKMETFRKFKQAYFDSLKQMPDHYPDEPFFVRALTELHEIDETMAIAVSDIDSFDPVIFLAALIMKKTPQNSPIKLTQSTPKLQSQTNNYGNYNLNFEYPPLRKTARKIILEFPTKEEISISQNKFNLPQENQPNNLENPGSVADESNPISQSEENMKTARPIKFQLKINSSPIMLFIEENLNYKVQMAAITKEFPKN